MNKENEYGDKFIDKFLNHFDEYSIDNPEYGHMILHVVLGQALKNIYFRVGARKIDIRLHFLFISPSGTGKGAGYGFYCKLCKDLGIQNEQLTEATDAGLAGTGIRLNDGDYEIIPGLLQEADTISMEEASPLFDYSTEFSKKNLTYMQITMNPLDDASCEISKRLGSIPDAIRFKPHGSFLLTTYIPDKFIEALVKRGVIQRPVTFMRQVSLEERMKVVDKSIDKINALTEESYDKEYQNIVTKLKSIINEYQKLGSVEDEEVKKFKIEEEKLKRITSRIAPTLNKKQQEKLCKTIQKEVNKLEKPEYKGFCFTIDKKVQKEMKHLEHELIEKIKDTTWIAQEKLAEFVHRIYEIMMRLAIHHAIIRMDRTVLSEDILYAKKVFTPIWISLIYNIEDLLMPTTQQRARMNFIIHRALEAHKNLIKENKKGIVKGKEWVKRSAMIKDLQTTWDNCSNVTASNRLYKLETDKVDETNKNKWFLRRKIGNSMYLKMVQDVV